MIGRDRRFSQFLISRGWLDVLARAPQDPEVLIAALDHYLGAYIQNTEYHFQMRQLVAFYAVASNLESLLLSLRESERCDGFGNLRLAFSPRANPALTGTGIDAPPLTGMLGIGACQLLRELYRVGRLSTPSGYQFAFTPVRKVRRLCFQLFGISEGPSSIESSQSIHNALSELGVTVGRDASFDRCFDLPLQMLAQDRNLRSSVLKVDFEVLSMKMRTLRRRRIKSYEHDSPFPPDHPYLTQRSVVVSSNFQRARRRWFVSDPHRGVSNR